MALMRLFFDCGILVAKTSHADVLRHFDRTR